MIDQGWLNAHMAVSSGKSEIAESREKPIPWPLIILHLRVSWDLLLKNVLNPQFRARVLLRNMTFL